MAGEPHRTVDARLRIAALIEWSKGLVVAAAALGIPTLMSDTNRHVLTTLLERFHFAGRTAIDSAWLEMLMRERRLVAAVALSYVLVRLVEGFGLWFGRAWARWLGIASCMAYLGIEIWHLLTAPGLAGMAAIAITLLLLWLLWPAHRPTHHSHLRETV